VSLALVYVPVGVVLGWCLFDGVYIFLARALGCYCHRAHFCVLRVVLLYGENA
jgi:hypothetical protein